MSSDITQNLPDDKLQQILDRLGAIETQLGGIDARMQALEARGYDTKPIWERVLAELVEANRRLDSLDRRFSVLDDDVLQSRADQRKLEERVGNLEHSRS